MRARLVVLAGLFFAGPFFAVRVAVPVALAQDPKRSTAFTTALDERPSAAQKVWVFFRDKGPDPSARLGEVALSPRARARRALRGQTDRVTIEDVPLVPSYVDAVAARVRRVRQQVAWLNAMSVEAGAAQVADVEALPFVARVDLVRGYRRRPEDELLRRASVDLGPSDPVKRTRPAAPAEWAEARGADVISSSLGYLTFDPGSPSYTFDDMNGTVAISTRAADLAGARGVVVVNSAGNEGPNALHNTLGAPADGLLVLAVGAVTSTGARATFSSVGPTSDGRTKPDVAAQGVAVTAAAPHTPSGYVTVSGTSFSCPLTAGVVALVLQARPSATVSEVEDALRATASQAGRPDNLLGWGIVDAAKAVQAIAP